MPTSKNILVAPLNWGLGHSVRCIPIINKLIAFGFNPVLGSDGVALELLKKEFPNLTAVELPSYQIKYTKKGKFFKWKIVLTLPKMLRAIKAEKKLTEKIIDKYNINGIISDNRFGVVSKNVPSVFMTHQLNVLSGTTTYLTSAAHRRWIKKFDECWVPDAPTRPNLSGKLGHLKNHIFQVKYLGPLSRFERKDEEQIYDLAVILSGPEPQRTLFENIIIEQLSEYEGKVIFVKGKIESDKKTVTVNNVTFHNFMNSSELEKVLNQSKTILCRSGYTSIMDLARLQKKAFFVPTPGQTEQEYLAQKFKKENIAPYSSQERFKIAMLDKVPLYKGFQTISFESDWKKIFEIFD